MYCTSLLAFGLTLHVCTWVTVHLEAQNSTYIFIQSSKWCKVTRQLHFVTIRDTHKVYTCIHVQIQAHAHTTVHMHTYVHIHAHVHTHAHIHTHTRLHTYTHIHIIVLFIHCRSYVATVIIAPVGGSLLCIIVTFLIICCGHRIWKKKSRSRYYTFDHKV